MEPDYFPTPVGDSDHFPITSESCFLRLLCSMNSFQSGRQSQLVLHSRNGYDLQFSALGTMVIAEQGDPFAYNSAAVFACPAFCTSHVQPFM